MQGVTQATFQAAVPPLEGVLDVAGLTAPVEIVRDGYGIPHLRATSLHDAFFAQGFVHAQDRLWQMEYDRRRAAGRWAEWGGAAWRDHDILMRRLDLIAGARADYDAFSAETRAVFDAYAAGVNAFIATSPILPAEFSLVDARPEPWEPWHGCAIYKVRHVLMGTWGQKLWRARLMERVGPDLLLTLRKGAETPGPLVSLPGVDYAALPDPGENLAALEATIGLWEWGAGSNNWAVHGSRTASGKPLVAGDPHRAIDVPNVYYQNHVACPDFDVIGYSFAGIPGFPHFGHNAEVAWCITHAGADYQDLYIERFAPGDPTRYEYQGEWHTAERRCETIQVRGAEPVDITVTTTHHGPIVIGDPSAGYALALRYTATDRPNRGFEAFLPMLRARTVDELDAAMAPWVDPANNFLMADRQGTIGYLMRGQVPLRSPANAWLPVPGWTGDQEWSGTIPFDELPRVRNPETGTIVTANNRIVGDDYPYHVTLDWAQPHRAIRITERLAGLRDATVADMAAIHADRLSLPSRVFVAALAEVTPLDETSAEAKRLLQDWDGQLLPDAVPPLLYVVWREQVAALFVEESVLAPLRGLPAPTDPPPVRLLGLGSRLRVPVMSLLAAGDTSLLPSGSDWPAILARALARACAWLTDRLGSEMTGWTYGRLHTTLPKHTLSASFPDLAPLLDPPAVPAGGDGDTPQAAAFAGLGGTGFALTASSVARYCFDLADWDNSGWVVPLGASGHPGSPHYADQVAAWRDVQLLPMRYSWPLIEREAMTTQRLEPA